MIILLVAGSCVIDDNRELTHLAFCPRKVSVLLISPGAQEKWEYGGNSGIYWLDMAGNAVEEDNFFLSVQTSNYDPIDEYKEIDPDFDRNYASPVLYYYDPFEHLDDPIPGIEQQISASYNKYAERSRSGKDYANRLNVEYRTTGIKQLTISALNTVLFGKQPGESLNDYFTIAEYDPRIVISSSGNMLIYGYSHNILDFPKSVGEWLNLSPMGQRAMFLTFNEKISDLPVSVRFVVQMETSEGLLLSDTTRLIT
ncbi:MAG: hypothetical protein LBU22_04230, partial [Dysgonamonadaceae bacterium]|nr:hypothetical protein [Dysgonamonadaceae bacterium]